MRTLAARALVLPRLRALSPDRTADLLLLAALFQAIGFQTFIPILPIYFTGLGASPQVVGAIQGGGLLAYGLSQYPAGWIADRFEARAVALYSTLVYAGFFFQFAVKRPDCQPPRRPSSLSRNQSIIVILGFLRAILYAWVRYLACLLQLTP